jgi:hypothetical protein
MSTVVAVRAKAQKKARPLPPLQNGDHLTRAEFERRNAAQPDIKKAELIEGIVHMPSPFHHDKHSKPHSRIVGWLFNYVVATPGTDFGDNATIRPDYFWVDDLAGLLQALQAGLASPEHAAFVARLRDNPA